MKCGALLASMSFAFALTGLVAGAQAESVKIGFSIDDLRVERWARDRDYFIAAARELGAEVNVQSADANEQRQIAQIENLISRGVKAMSIVPFNSKVLTNVIADAKKAGVKIVSYDRLILNADIDAYITFDNERIGAMQSEGLVARLPKGNYYLLGGAPTDHNSKLLRAGQMSVLKPYVDRGDIKIVGSQYVNDWLPINALSIIENALTASGNKIDAVVASNDGTAGGAIQALAAQGLAGKVLVSGQDAELAAIKRILDGTQAMTVYVPLKPIATEAAKITVQLAKGEKPSFNAKIENGVKDVDSVFLTPILLDKSNIDLVVQDGFYTREEVYGK